MDTLFLFQLDFSNLHPLLPNTRILIAARNPDVSSKSLSVFFWQLPAKSSFIKDKKSSQNGKYLILSFLKESITSRIEAL